MRSFITRSVYLIIFLLGYTGLAQIKLGDNPTEISPYALLEIESTNKGLIVPRMSTQQRDAAFGTNAPLGTVIYNTDTNKLQYLQSATDPASKKTTKSWKSSSGGTLVKVIENGKIGYRLADANPTNHGDIGTAAVDFSRQTAASTGGATGDTSTAFGVGTTAESFAQTTLGAYNTVHSGTPNASGSTATDRLLVLGNGTSAARSDALVILKNGNTELNGTLTLNPTGTSSYILPTAKGTTGQVLAIANAVSGTTTWTTVSGVGGGSGGATQTLSASALSANNTMTLTISQGNTITLDFSSLAGSGGGSGSATQTLTANLQTNTLTIAISGGNTQTINLASINTDEQNIEALAFNSSTASLTVGITDGTSQTISLASLLSGGGSGGALVKVTESGKTGYRLADANPANHGDIGTAAVDFSSQTTASTTKGATGNHSIAFGENITASGNYGAALGRHTTASGFASTAFGRFSNAIGDISTAFGSETEAKGYASTAFGLVTTAESYGQISLGTFNTAHPGTPNATGATATDRLLVVGNGTVTARSDALVILKNGNVGIGVSNPSSYKLDVAGDINTSGAIRKSGTAYIHPDYVFEKYFGEESPALVAYEMLSLQEVETFIKANKHLPGVQNRKDLETQGSWNVSENVRTNLEKVEELYLHTIEQQKQLESQQEEMETQRKEIENQQKEIDLLKLMLQQLLEKE